MARTSSRRGRLALRLGLVLGLLGLVAAVILTVLLLDTMGGLVDAKDKVEVEVLARAWQFYPAMCVVIGLVVGGVAWALGNSIATRLTDLSLAVNKLGRGSAAVRVRIAGNDEVTSVGASLQYLASDLATMFAEQEKAGTVQAGFDPQVRALRDKALAPNGLDAVAGFEVDAALANGSRGGLDYYGSAGKDGLSIIYLVSAEGSGALAIYACRLARDELQRALEAGANARKALSHTNRVLHRVLPPSVCAKATLLELGAEEVKLYQAGTITPALRCAAGQVEEVVAEGLALGLDEGPVFEKQIRSAKIAVAQGVRIVLTNDAGHRHGSLRALVQEHSPKNTPAFMNMVLGALESEAGSDGLREEIALVTAKRW